MLNKAERIEGWANRQDEFHQQSVVVNAVNVLKNDEPTKDVVVDRHSDHRRRRQNPADRHHVGLDEFFDLFRTWMAEMVVTELLNCIRLLQEYLQQNSFLSKEIAKRKDKSQ